ncbi:potassium transport system protein kup [Acrasis kona]|uniref:Potassium transport system protein kup n=1 Tax=Acrasis kona TaxID=1008807 RepID=A0AAW2ZI83_9EUKA
MVSGTAISGIVVVVCFVVLGLINLAFAIYPFALSGAIKKNYNQDINISFVGINAKCLCLTSANILNGTGVVLLLSTFFCIVAIVGQAYRIMRSFQSEEQEIISWITLGITFVANFIFGIIATCIHIAFSTYTWRDNCNSLSGNTYYYYFEYAQTYAILHWVFPFGVGTIVAVVALVVALFVGGGAGFLKNKLSGVAANKNVV